MIYIFSLDTNPYKKCARNSKNLHKHKNMRNDQRHLFLHKMRAKHEIGELKSDINVALLCIQHRWLPTSWLRAPGFKGFRHIPLGPCSGFKAKRCNFSSFFFLFLFFYFGRHIGLLFMGVHNLLHVVNETRVGFAKFRSYAVS